MKIKTWVKVAVALVAGAGLTLGMPALAAVGESSPPASAVHIRDNVALLARGVAATVPLRVVCPAGERASLSASLSEASGKTITSGFGSTTVLCTGSTQRVVVSVAAQLRPFKSGPALATAQVSGCSFFPGPGCTFANDSRVVRLS